MAVAALAIADPAGAGGRDGGRMPGGTRPPTAAELAVLEEVLARPGTDSTEKVSYTDELPPAVVKNHLYLPAVQNQQLDNCAAFAPTYYYRTYQEARERGWVRPDPATHPERVMSPGFTFPLSNGGKNDGASLEYVLWILCRFGTATWQDMPEDPQDWWSYPTEEQWRRAIPFRADRVIGFDPRTDAGLATIKAHLATGDPLVTTIRMYHDTHDPYPNGVGVNNHVIYGVGSQMGDLHVFTVIGYDDNKAYHDGVTARTGAFLAVNSWGPHWGVVDPDVGTGGFVWFGYEYIKNGALSESVAYALTDRAAYEPRFLAVIDIDHPRRNELTVGLREGGATDWVSSFPGLGAIPFTGRMVVDVSDTAAERPYAFWLSASDVLGVPGAQGWINRFVIEWGDGRSTMSLDAPMQTVDWTPTNTAVQLYAGLLGPSGQVFDRGIGTEPGNHQMDEFVGGWADWNLDGRPDVLLGATRFSYDPDYTLLYGNRGGSFAVDPVAPALPMAVGGSVSWTDSDRDGYPDFLLTGYDITTVPFAALYRTDGVHGFTNAAAGLPGISHGTGAWGDFDNDGDADVALCGTDAGWATLIQVWRNDGPAGFTHTGIVFPEAVRGALAWADLNHDGWLDLSIGDKLFRNNGDGTFSDWRSMIAGRMDGAHAWGDFDGDGDLDLAACELNSDYVPARYTMEIYRNNGEIFVDAEPEGFWVLLLLSVPGTSPGLAEARLTWADFDNDGRLDLAACGATGQDAGLNVQRRTLLLRQESDGTFRDVGFNVPGLGNGVLAWADVDGDGDLDLFAAGRESDSATRSSAALYVSRIADGDGGNQPNHAPMPPLNLVASQTNAMIRLSWDPATDVETPSLSLSYEVRVGSLPGACDVISPVDVPALLGSQGQRRLAAGVPGALLRIPPAGRYYWSVRSLDGGLLRSPWSAEQSFTVGAGGMRTGDLNADGQLDIADLIRCGRMARGILAPDFGLADMTADGRVDDNDTRALVAMLLPAGATTYVPLKTATLDGAGGTLEGGGFQLIVPPGALTTAATVQLLASSDDKPFGSSSPRTMFRVSGLPATFAQPLTIRFPGTLTNAGTRAYLAVGEQNMGTGNAQENRTGYLILDGAVGADRVPAFTLPANGGAPGLRAFSAPVAASEDPDPLTWTWTFGGMFGDSVLVVNSAHFKAARPSDWVNHVEHLAQMSNLVTDLESAFQQAPEAGFTFAARRAWPVNVTILTGTPATADLGTSRNSMLGDDYGYLEFDWRVFRDAERRRTTACHEFCHLVQALFDPRNAYSKAKFASDHYWFDEAVATWFERYGAADPATYMPVNYNAYRVESHDGGMLCPAMGFFTSRSRIAQHGYGMAAMAEHLAARFPDTGGKPPFGSIYAELLSGRGLLDAIGTATGDGDGDIWCHAFYAEWLKGTLYPTAPLTLLTAAPLVQRFLIKSPAQRLAEYFPRVPGIGTGAYGVTFDSHYSGLTRDDVLAFSLRGNGHQRIAILTAFREDDRQSATNTITPDHVVPEMARCFLPEIDQLAAAGRSAYAVITSNDADDPGLPPPGSQRLHIGLARELNGVQTIPAFAARAPNLLINTESIAFPRYACTGTFSTDPVYGSYTSSVIVAGITAEASLSLTLWKDGVITLPVVFAPVLSSSTFETNLPSGDRRRYTVTETHQRLVKKVSPDWTETRRTDIGDSFQVDLLEHEDGALFSVYIAYNMTEEDFTSDGTPLRNSTYTGLFFNVMHMFLWRL